MDKVLIPLNLFYKMLKSIDDNNLCQQVRNAKVVLYAPNLALISDALKADATRFPRVANILNDLATSIEK